MRKYIVVVGFETDGVVVFSSDNPGDDMSKIKNAVGDKANRFFIKPVDNACDIVMNVFTLAMSSRFNRFGRHYEKAVNALSFMLYSGDTNA